MVLTQKASDTPHIQEKYLALLNRFGITPNKIYHYILAFTHRSIVNERPDFAPEHNERLEFLGDAVLELVITENLYLDYPEKTEGDLTDIRSAIVRGRNLAQVAISLKLADFLILGKGEEQCGGRNNDYLLANVVEAFIGALYVDLGLKTAKNFIDTYIYPSVKEIIANNLLKDYKTTIQEYVQAQYDITPVYKVLSESGLDHDKTFEVGVYMGEKMIGVGYGGSKKRAQEKAAENGFNNLTQK